ncbi:GNAT family N-acetyltransferase [Sulfitobacter pseudonitzschiae]|uniref:GNAT family N-acetyltransferase n=1 Tax=Pseudosulfitobacter pseudonitzschiae TaxID=1402135 RepID=A0A9Q2NGC9_9RHOB|nr:GNAT family N-acetyltransferase [Pseudosulfitobacter pseudonitzschiae]MBM2291527.1 GNAT family N-acetyltransferase [Pseudosulfitobacter pseudonitzschiae]MBM2296445.1 GNAT family N-acetyltransferase [Pseudosulfitobacter pseudonitzschiae]MBM2301358.1 GNAT family N-acetyltransferase [Pseudosulfitobacter pseudonitzschiae]MBM2311142.1 GNAT family N-acetyltransferase [Pseudosulfitobacter pseudonitzschiae]MBM2316055.1 GNAT family N-acetyltransferase [Pseudosulfitobacter pseudonitzschiae]
MNAVEIRAARPLDAGTVGAILGANVDATPWLPRIHTRAEEVMFAADMIDAGWVTTARTDAGVVGFLALQDTEIQALYVAPEAQNRAAGTALLNHAKARHRRLGLWSFAANAGANRFYQRAGFRPVQHTDGAGNDVGLPDVRYEWHADKETL